MGGHRTGAAGEVLERGGVQSVSFWHYLSAPSQGRSDSTHRLDYDYACEPGPRIRSCRDSWQFMQFQAESADMTSPKPCRQRTFALCPCPSWPYLPYRALSSPHSPAILFKRFVGASLSSSRGRLFERCRGLGETTVATTGSRLVTVRIGVRLRPSKLWPSLKK